MRKAPCISTDQSEIQEAPPRLADHGGSGQRACHYILFGKTFAELTTAAPLDIRGIGEAPLTPYQLSGLYAVADYRYENLLPTTTHTDKGP